MDEVKSRYGRNTVITEFDGELPPGFPGLAAAIIRYPRYAEIELESGATSQQLLKALVDQVAVRRFEVALPRCTRSSCSSSDGAPGGHLE